jgi:hypothetical protein
MAGRMVRSCVQTALKAANSVVGLAGMAVILYALWMLRAWYREVADLQQHLPVPWSATASSSSPSSSSLSCLLADLGLRVKQAPRFAGSLAPSLRCYWFLLATRPSLRFASRNASAFRAKFAANCIHCTVSPNPFHPLRLEFSPATTNRRCRAETRDAKRWRTTRNYPATTRRHQPSLLSGWVHGLVSSRHYRRRFGYS